MLQFSPVHAAQRRLLSSDQSFPNGDSEKPSVRESTPTACRSRAWLLQSFGGKLSELAVWEYTVHVLCLGKQELGL